VVVVRQLAVVGPVVLLTVTTVEGFRGIKEEVVRRTSVVVGVVVQGEQQGSTK
jgi:hypothetical protein